MLKQFFGTKGQKSIMNFMFAFMMPMIMGISQLKAVDEGAGAEAELLEKIEKATGAKVESVMKTMNETIEELKKSIPEKGKFVEAKDIQEVASKAAEQLKAAEEAFGKKIEELQNDESMSKQLTEMNDILKQHGLEIKKFGEQQKNQTEQGVDKDQVKELIHKYTQSEEFKAWIDSGATGQFERKAMLKDGTLINADNMDKEQRDKTVSVSVDHTGNIFITEPRLNIRDFPQRQSHIRDLMPVESTSSTQITAPEVYDYTDALTMGVEMLGENDEAPDIGFKTRENTWTISRIAAKLPLSKRYIKTNGLRWVAGYLGRRLPNAVRNKEDFQILFGNGQGDNVDGLVKDAQQFNLTPQSYTAGAISNYEAYQIVAVDDSTRVTFVNDHNLRNGDNFEITAGNTDPSYLGLHTSVIVEDAKTIIIPVPFVAGETVANWVASGISTWYQAVQNPQIYDVLVVSKSLLQTAEYMATGIVINPADFDKMGLIKASDNQYVGVARDAFGRITVNGLPIVTSTFMPAGQFLVGDFQMAVALSEYTSLSIKAYEDTQDGAKNQVTWIIEEEFILPKYNPFWFIYGRFDTAITQIAKP